ncbi:uncharacterized protein LOC143011380 isoform X3 [Genypterus blacodes]|uniref:uncharacterized protein LOC143011380 isoform X3 n=1 Tax=Genypterus blacodes TaxID=154954 RepID=UPI003F76B7AC
MSKLQVLRVQVNERLTAAVGEILGLFERTIIEYEEELSRSQQRVDHQHKQLRAALNPEVRLYRADIQQLLVQQECRLSFDQEEPEPPHIKEEQRELWTSEEGEQLHGVEEAEITRVPVKSEVDEKEVQSTQLHQNQTEENTEAELLPSSSGELMKTEADGEDGEQLDMPRNSDPDIQQLLVQQEWRLSFDQEEPEPPHIKEEQRELWTSEEGEQLRGVEEAGKTRVPVKSEDDGREDQSTQLHQNQTEENTEAELLSRSSVEQRETEADGEDGGQLDLTRDCYLALPEDNQQLVVQQKWCQSLDQEEPESQPIQEELKALYISQEVEQLHDLGDSVKSENSEAAISNSM